MARKPVLMLVDGNNLVYRSFFAIPPLTNREGLPTNAIYGFATVLRKFLSEQQPESAAVVFDAGGRTFRHEVFKQYKANRPPTPDNLALQFPYTRELCDALGVAKIEMTGVEADDLIGTLATRAITDGYRVLIVSSDKDFLQLVNEDITVVHPSKETRLDIDGVKEKFGVRPDQVIDVLALMGDSVDNVPGVPGIGEKGAAKLIADWGSVESAIEHRDEIKNKRQREGLTEHREQALLSKRLVRIVTDVVVDMQPSSMRYAGARREQAFELFDRLGFTTLLKNYLPEQSTEEVIYHDLRDRKSIDKLVKLARRHKKICLWVNARDPKRFDPWSAEIQSLGLSVEPSETFVAEQVGPLDEPTLLQALQVLFEDPSVRTVGYDLKSLMLFLARKGIDLRGPVFDIRVATYVLNPSRRSQELEALLLEFTGRGLSDSKPDETNGQPSLPGVSVEGGAERGGRLAAEKAERLHELSEKIASRLADEGLTELYENLELPLIRILVDMERCGIAIDRNAFAKMSVELSKQIELLTAEIYELSGCEFNINSPKQLAEVLFEKMSLPSFKKTQKQRLQSTRVEVLEELAQHFELPKKILDYRSFAKLRGTYVDALPALVRPETGRIHTSFNQTVAATGRLSSSDPNLQNIPIRTELGRRIRQAFVAKEGALLVSADYSQIELRVLAHLSEDEALVEAFEQDADIHDRTARELFGDDSSLSEPEKRRRAKIVNFSIIYGKTAFTLGKEFGVSTREAQAFIDSYFDRYPKVRELVDDIIREARRTGKVRTLFGRHRYIPEIGSRNRNSRMAAERVAVNSPIQGTAADLIKKAMIELSKRLPLGDGDARLLLQVHDELVLEVVEDRAEEVASLVKEVMENVYPLAVPLRVDVATGKSWEH